MKAFSISSLWRAVVLCAVACSFGSGLSAQGTALRDKVFVTTGEGIYHFGTYLFSLNPSIKEHPERLAGRASMIGAGLRLPHSFMIGAEAFEDRASGTGKWLDIDGADPEEAAFLPIATGTTRLKVRGIMLGMRKDFRIRMFHPYVEAAAGGGRLSLAFNGTVTATDPEDGETFVVAANDTVRQWIPVGHAGVGLDVPLRPGLSLTGGYRWQEGSVISIGMRVFPFGRPAR